MSIAHSISEKMDIVVDDRDLSFGRKISDSHLVGIPNVMIIGKKSKEGIVEIENRISGQKSFICQSDLESFLSSIN